MEAVRDTCVDVVRGQGRYSLPLAGPERPGDAFPWLEDSEVARVDIIIHTQVMPQ